jgi:hypothetical protein
MAAFLTNLTAVERLAAHVNSLPKEFSKSLGEDLEYARLGAVLPELPRFGGWSSAVGLWVGHGREPRFTALFKRKAPVAFGLKAAELVANGALVGSEAGLAFLAGYFTQLCVSRSLEPLIQELVHTYRRRRESDSVTRERVEWAQALMLMQELHGSVLVGTPAIRNKLQVRKVSSIRGIGRGFFEIIRVASQEAAGVAPSKLEVDGWMRGLYLYSVMVGSPVGKLRARGLSEKGVYRAPGVDVFAAVDRGLEHSREVLTLLGALIRRNSFSHRSRARLLAICPEGSSETAAFAPKLPVKSSSGSPAEEGPTASP